MSERKPGMQPGATKGEWEIEITLERASTDREYDRLLDQLAGANMQPSLRMGGGRTYVGVTVRATTLASACSRTFQEISKCLGSSNVPIAIESWEPES